MSETKQEVGPRFRFMHFMPITRRGALPPHRAACGCLRLVPGHLPSAPLSSKAELDAVPLVREALVREGRCWKRFGMRWLHRSLCEGKVARPCGEGRAGPRPHTEWGTGRPSVCVRLPGCYLRRRLLAVIAGRSPPPASQQSPFFCTLF